MADVPLFNIRCNKLTNSNFYSFSRKKPQQLHLLTCMQKRENFIIVKGKQEINRKELKGQL